MRFQFNNPTSRQRLLVLGVLSSGLSGCFNPLLPVPQSTIAPIVRAPQSAMPDQFAPNWWQVYDDAQLNAVVTEALAANRQLQQAAATVLEYRAAVQAIAPSAWHSNTALWGSRGNSAAGGQPEGVMADKASAHRQSNYAASFDLQWELDIFKRLSALKQVSSAALSAVQADQAALQLLIAAETTRAWLMGCNTVQQQRLLQQQLQLLAQQAQLSEKMYHAGRSTAADLLQRQSHYARVLATQATLQQQLQQHQSALNILMARPPTLALSIAQQCQQLPPLQHNVQHLEATVMLQRRPDIYAAEQRLRAATAQRNVAQADLYPRIQLGAGVYQPLANSPQNNASRATVWRIGPLLSWQFPNFSAARAAIAQADARAVKALAQFDQQIIVALNEWQQALHDDQVMGAAQQQQRQAWQYSLQRQHMAEQSVKLGRLEYMTQLDLQLEQLEQAALLAQQNQNYIATQIQLFKVFAGRWQHAPAPAPATTTALQRTAADLATIPSATE
ncbi:TolC family protein [Acinetobacter larvae]|nr:TolC family protein [Acinetobacter larvae]